MESILERDVTSLPGDSCLRSLIEVDRVPRVVSALQLVLCRKKRLLLSATYFNLL